MAGPGSGGGGASGAAVDDIAFMRQAIGLARAGWGRVHPNPLVGAVVVDGGRVVGVGAHREYGGAHAEVEALAAAGDAAAGSTLYVTLEPCAHEGKTPPCTDAILAAGISRVVFAVPDPHPRGGGGARQLRAAGVEVTGGVEEDAARTQNALFLGPLEGRDPFLALKYGLSLDARLGRRGEATRVTGPDAEREAHRLRAGFDAILVGAATARVDDPLLTVRHAPPPRSPPIRLVADPSVSLAPDSRLARSVDQAPVWALAGEGSAGDPAAGERVAALTAAGVRVLPCPVAGGTLDLRATLRLLAAEGIHTILCEGGGRLGAALLRVGAVDRLYLFYAPVLFGDAAVPAFPGEAAVGPERVVETRMIGQDILMVLDRSR